MSIIQSIVVSLFCIALVFLVLSFLFALVKILSVILQKLAKNMSKATDTSAEVEIVANMVENTEINALSSGDLKLFNVDEKTAAMIMAIVSHESEIPLSELSFKSIRAVE